MKEDIEKLRSRWLRWLGGITRQDRHSWGVLMLSNFTGWAYRINQGEYPKIMGREESKDYYKRAIQKATIEDFHQLDILWLNYKK